MGFVSGQARPSGGAPFAPGGGGGIPDAPSDGNTYGRKDGAWVVIPPGAQDTITFEFSRGGNTSTNAPIGPDSGANGAPGFVVPCDCTLSVWTMACNSANANLDLGLNITVINAGWTPSTTQVTTAADKDPGGNDQRADGTMSIAVLEGDLLAITSAVNEGGADRTVSQVVVKIKADVT